MPIASSEPIVDLTTAELGKHAYRVISHAFASQDANGWLADEIVCHREVEHWLVDGGFQVQCTVASQ